MTKTKTLTNWMVVDWKSGSTRTRKSKPKASDLGTNELLAKVEIDIEVPDVDVPTLALEIDVPEPKVHAATMEALDGDDLPDWTDTANEVLEAADVPSRDTGELGDLVEQMAFQTIREAPGRPDPDLVEEYLNEQTKALRASPEQ